MALLTVRWSLQSCNKQLLQNVWTIWIYECTWHCKQQISSIITMQVQRTIHYYDPETQQRIGIVQNLLQEKLPFSNFLNLTVESLNSLLQESWSSNVVSCGTNHSCSKLFYSGQNIHQFQISCCFFFFLFFISFLNPKTIIPAAAAAAASRVSEKSSSIIISSMPTWLTRMGIFLINATTTPPSFPILSPSVGSLFFLVPLVDNHSTCFTPDPIHALVRRC